MSATNLVGGVVISLLALGLIGAQGEAIGRYQITWANESDTTVSVFRVDTSTGRICMFAWGVGEQGGARAATWINLGCTGDPPKVEPAK